jgi:xylan 1,4-beta-xylosidase
MVCGNALVNVNGTEYRINEGMGAFIRSEDIHSIKCTDGSVVEVIKIHNELIKFVTDKYSLTSPIISAEILENYFVSIKSETNLDEFSDISKESAAIDLTVSIFRSEEKKVRESVNSPAEERFKNLLDYLEVNYGEATFDIAASKMNLSRPYFSKLFYSRMGMTFTRYINLIKVSSAVRLINERKMKITDIAYRCGFGTIRSFNRVFKDATGFSPKELPADYVPEYTPKYSSDIGCDPTLSTTDIIF